MPSRERNHALCVAQLEELQRLCAPPELYAAEAPSVSAWSVGKHVEHLLLADRHIFAALSAILAGTDARLQRHGSPSLIGRLCLWFGRIPRGRGRAPDMTLPAALPAAEVASGLGELHQRARGLASRLAELGAARGRLPHPALGSFSGSQWLRFVTIHHRHHLDIVRDIRRAVSRAGS